jgi:helicase required for RNAi-mediated heterochromatin assembly 1
LIGGSIVALSPAYDHFRSQCVVAVVAARPLEEVEKQPHEIDIYVVRAEDTQFDTQQEWVMVEARSGYYESNRYTMTALQKMAKERYEIQIH